MPVNVSRQAVRHPTKHLQEDARALLRHLGLSRSELSVVLCDDAFIQGLNLQWRGKDAPTDVLSFSMREGPPVGLGGELLGDVVISVETCARQAASIGHAPAREMRVLLVHGLLHLIGYDHETSEEDARVMRAREAELLRAIGEDPTGLVERASSAPGGPDAP